MLADHPRRKALDGVKRMLWKTTSAGEVVYIDRADPLPGSVERAILIETADVVISDPSEDGGFDSQLYILSARITSLALTPIERDDLSLEVETAMAGSFGTLHRGMTNLALGVFNEGANAYFAAAMTYAVFYRIGETEPASSF